MRWLAVLAFVALLSACPKPTPTPVGPTPDADAGPVLPPPNCSAACTNETGLGCSGAPTCPGLCPRLMRNHPEYVVCVTGATSCPAIAACDKAATAGGATHGPGSGRTGP